METFMKDIEILSNDEGIHIRPVFANVDRPKAFGICVSKKYASRVVAAFKSGKAFPNLRILTDVNGKTFASWDSVLFGKTLNSDLKRLGF